MLPLFNTRVRSGAGGAVIASLAGFALIRDAVLQVSSNPWCRSRGHECAGGDHRVVVRRAEHCAADPGADYLAMAQAGISPALHRVAVMAAGGMDTLPHCGAIITLLAICKLNHRQSYGDIAAVTMLFPLPALMLVIALGTWVGSFEVCHAGTLPAKARAAGVLSVP
jgi:hypothetical protein